MQSIYTSLITQYMAQSSTFISGRGIPSFYVRMQKAVPILQRGEGKKKATRTADMAIMYCCHEGSPVRPEEGRPAFCTAASQFLAAEALVGWDPSALLSANRGTARTARKRCQLTNCPYCRKWWADVGNLVCLVNNRCRCNGSTV